MTADDVTQWCPRCEDLTGLLRRALKNHDAICAGLRAGRMRSYKAIDDMMRIKAAAAALGCYPAPADVLRETSPPESTARRIFSADRPRCTSLGPVVDGNGRVPCDLHAGHKGLHEWCRPMTMGDIVTWWSRRGQVAPESAP